MAVRCSASTRPSWTRCTAAPGRGARRLPGHHAPRRPADARGAVHDRRGRLWWRGERALDRRSLQRSPGNALLNPALKLVFERVRPLDAPRAAASRRRSFPSGTLVGLARRLRHARLRAAAHAAARLAPAGGVSRRARSPSRSARAGLRSGALRERRPRRIRLGSAWLVTCIVSAELALAGNGGTGVVPAEAQHLVVGRHRCPLAQRKPRAAPRRRRLRAGATPGRIRARRSASNARLFGAVSTPSTRNGP